MFKTPKPSKKPHDFKTAAVSQYDWDTLLNGEQYDLKHGEHFDCKVATFSTLARSAASKRYKKLSVGIIDETTVAIKATDMTEAERAEEDQKRAERELAKETKKAEAKAETVADQAA